MTIFVSKLFMIYNISAFDSKAPAKSVAAVLNKAVKLFSTIKFDVAPYVENSYATVTEVKLHQLVTVVLLKSLYSRLLAST